MIVGGENMTITSEKIREIQSEIDVTYEEAERYLRRARGDVELAVHLLKIRKDSRFNHFYEETVRIFKEFMVYRLIIKKDEEVFINIPLLLVIVMFWVIDWGNTLFIFIVATGFVLMTNSEIALKRVEAKEDSLAKEKEEGQAPTKTSQTTTNQQASNQQASNQKASNQQVSNQQVSNRDVEQKNSKGHEQQSEESKTDEYNEIVIDK